MVKRIQIGRLVYANPAEGERYYLRIMLNHVRGATSYENMRTWRGVTYATFRQACEAMGLVESDKKLDDCLRESAEFRLPCSLRRLFATIMVFFVSVLISGVFGITILTLCLRIFAVHVTTAR